MATTTAAMECMAACSSSNRVGCGWLQQCWRGRQHKLQAGCSSAAAILLGGAEGPPSWGSSCA